jgi:hypothetical protein
VSLDELIETLREVLLAKGVEVDLSAEDVTRAYLRRKVGKERLGVTQPDDEEG